MQGILRGMKLNRRTLIYGSAGTALMVATDRALPAPTQLDVSTAPVAAPPQVTRILAQFVVQSRAEDLPAAVLNEGARTLLNWTGCAIGGSRQPAVDKESRLWRRFQVRRRPMCSAAPSVWM